jgi:hypothetical protein
VAQSIAIVWYQLAQYGSNWHLRYIKRRYKKVPKSVERNGLEIGLKTDLLFKKIHRSRYLAPWRHSNNLRYSTVFKKRFLNKNKIKQ